MGFPVMTKAAMQQWSACVQSLWLPPYYLRAKQLPSARLIRHFKLQKIYILESWNHNYSLLIKASLSKEDTLIQQT